MRPDDHLRAHAGEPRRTSPAAWRWRWYPRAVLFALALAFAIALASGRGARTLSGRLGGDFVPLYAAGRVILGGEGARLYDWGRQRAAQEDLFPDEPDVFLPFPYPPFVALAYAPLARLPYRLAYALHTLFMAACVLAALWLAGRRLLRAGRYTGAALAAALTFFPLHRAVFGGQNVPLTLLLITAAWHLASARRELAAGACLGLLFYKPQFAVIMIGLYLVHRRWRAMLGALTSAAVLYLASSAIGGLDWPLWWWREGVVPFQDADQSVNAANSIGWLGFLEGWMGVGDPLARSLGYGAALLTALWIAHRWWRGTERDWPERVGLAAAGAILISPHAMYYEAGLLVLPLLVLAERRGQAAIPLLAAVWAGGLTQVLAPSIGFSPLFLIAVATLALAMRVASARPPDASLPETRPTVR